MKKRQKTTNKDHPTNSEVQRIIKDIRTLRDNNKSDIEIRETLGLELRTYQRYTKAIHEEDKQVWYEIASSELEGELLKLRMCLNNSYNIAKKMSEDETAAIGERLEACQAASDCRLSLVQILREYPSFVKASQTQTQPSEEYTKNVEISEQGSPIKASTLKRIH